MPHLSQHATMDNFMVSLIRDHQRYLPIVEYLDKVIQGASELTWDECERIGLELGGQNGSGFCAGIRAGLIGVLQDEPENPKRDITALLTFARKLNEASSTITKQDISVVRDAGWNDQTVEDVIGLVSVLKIYSILANGFGFDALPAQTFAEMGQATVKMDGYTPMFKSFLE